MTVDTTVAVAAFATWHEDHAVAIRAISGGPRLIAHVALETYSVLTRLPPPHRVEPSAVLAFLTRNFGGRWLTLRAVAYQALVSAATRAGIAGGGIYDALIGAVARDAGEELATLDRRALPVYRAVGASVRFLR